jgi:hypothetical protein
MRYLLLLVFGAGCATFELEGMEDPATTGEAIAYATADAIPACPVGQWCVEPAPVSGAPLLHAVWAISADDVFAVGDTGTILRRTNNEWVAMASGTTRNLRGVWAASASNVWAVGVSGTILRFNGTAWSSVTGIATSDIDAVWGSGPNDVWLVGGTTVQHWNGTAFSVTGFGGTLLAVSGSGPNDVWVTGENMNLRRFNGTSWSTVNPGAGTSTFFSVLALTATEVWAADFNPGKEAMRLVGGRWVAFRTGGGIFNGLTAFSTTNVWGAGGSRVGQWNGTAWTLTQPFGANASLWSISATTGHVWIAGSNGLIGHRAF